ncbi:MAG: G1 family glutamic endopeptidase [Ktedonobacterales bacterium]
MADWKHLVENIKVRDCMTPVLGDRISSTIQGPNSRSSKAHGLTGYSLVGSFDDYIYDGYEPVAATFYSASAEWVVPSYVSVSGYANATDTHWVSIGGDGTNMWQAGIEVDQRNGFRFWNEEVNAQNTCCPVNYEGPVISPGNTVSAYVDYCFTYTNPCESYVYVANQTTGHSFSRYVTWTPGTGNTFFISERSTVNGCITPLEEWKEAQNPQNLLYSIPWQLAYAGEITGGIHEDQELGLYPYYGYSMTTNGPSGGTLLAEHTAVGSDNRSFYTTWDNFGPKNSC